MSEDRMYFPKNWHEFIDDYSFKDTLGIYTNNAYLIPKFRAEQALEHYADGLFNQIIKTINMKICEYIDFVCKDLPYKDEEFIRVLLAMAISRCKTVIKDLKEE